VKDFGSLSRVSKYFRNFFTATEGAGQILWKEKYLQFPRDAPPEKEYTAPLTWRERVKNRHPYSIDVKVYIGSEPKYVKIHDCFRGMAVRSLTYKIESSLGRSVREAVLQQ
jgi:hypothetical protein